MLTRLSLLLLLSTAFLSLSPFLQSHPLRTPLDSAAPLLALSALKQLSRSYVPVLILMERLMGKLKGRKLKENKRKRPSLSPLPSSWSIGEWAAAAAVVLSPL